MAVDENAGSRVRRKGLWGHFAALSLLASCGLIAPTPEEAGPISYDPPGVGGFACFAAGTPIRTPRGEVPIESLVEGDLVLSYDERLHQIVPGRVVGRMSAEKPIGRFLREGGAPLFVTAEHPFYFPELGAYRAVGTIFGEARLLALAQGEELRATSAVAHGWFASGERSQTVYNITVDGHHNYFAGGVLVHNKPPPCSPHGGPWLCPVPEYPYPCSTFPWRLAGPVKTCSGSLQQDLVLTDARSLFLTTDDGSGLGGASSGDVAVGGSALSEGGAPGASDFRVSVSGELDWFQGCDQARNATTLAYLNHGVSDGPYGIEVWVGREPCALDRIVARVESDGRAAGEFPVDARPDSVSADERAFWTVQVVSLSEAPLSTQLELGFRAPVR